MAVTHAAAFTHARPWSMAEFDDLLNAGAFGVGDARCFALVRVVLDEAELLTIATDPVHRRIGLARACMIDWQKMARTRGAARGFLEVAADNHPAITMYRHCGFSDIGRRPGYYRRAGQDNCDALMMARDLP